ncbi:MAG: thioredoxin family protein [Saprospiraceae bacterium]|nr:thioredoxin family protein [Saprospiraceae bacterium]
MKRISLIIFNCLLLIQLSGQGIEFFEGTWQEALEVANKEGKAVFIDAYAVWCGPCKRMAREVFTKKDVGEFYNENFINVKLDMEKSDGLSFGKKYPVYAYPTLYYLKGDGEVLKSHKGGQSVTGLINLGKSALRSNDTSGDFVEEYEAGNRDIELMIGYVSALNKVGKPSKKISNDYINSEPNITNDQMAEFLMAAVVDADSKLFDRLLELEREAVQNTSMEDYTKVVHNAVLKTTKKAIDFEYPELFHQAIDKFVSTGIPNKEQFELEASMQFHSLSGNYDQWVKLSKKYLKKFGKKDPSLYTVQIAVANSEFDYVEAAHDYINELYQSLIDRDDSLDNYYAYTNNLLNKKQYDEALKVAEEALKKGRDRKEDVLRFERIVDFLQKQN